MFKLKTNIETRKNYTAEQIKITNLQKHIEPVSLF